MKKKVLKSSLAVKRVIAFAKRRKAMWPYFSITQLKGLIENVPLDVEGLIFATGFVNDKRRKRKFYTTEFIPYFGFDKENKPKIYTGGDSNEIGNLNIDSGIFDDTSHIDNNEVIGGGGTGGASQHTPPPLT